MPQPSQTSVRRSTKHVSMKLLAKTGLRRKLIYHSFTMGSVLDLIHSRAMDRNDEMATLLRELTGRVGLADRAKIESIINHDVSFAALLGNRRRALSSPVHCWYRPSFLRLTIQSRMTTTTSSKPPKPVPLEVPLNLERFLTLNLQNAHASNLSRRHHLRRHFTLLQRVLRLRHLKGLGNNKA